jgi:hypothetical protein
MLWDDSENIVETPKDLETEVVIQNWGETDGHFDHHSTETPDIEYTPDFTDFDKRTNRMTNSRKSEYVKRSIGGRLKENRFTDPFRSFRTDEDFRY